MNVAQETLGFRRAGLSPALSLLMSAFALPIPPARVPPRLHRSTERSPTTRAIPSARSHVRLDFESRFGLGTRRISRRLTSHSEVSLVQARTLEHTQVDCAHPRLRLLAYSPVTSSAQDDSTSELLRFL